MLHRSNGVLKGGCPVWSHIETGLDGLILRLNWTVAKCNTPSREGVTQNATHPLRRGDAKCVTQNATHPDWGGDAKCNTPPIGGMSKWQAAVLPHLGGSASAVYS